MIVRETVHSMEYGHKPSSQGNTVFVRGCAGEFDLRDSSMGGGQLERFGNHYMKTCFCLFIVFFLYEDCFEILSLSF